MKRILCLMALSYLLPSQGRTQEKYLIPESTNRILFLGNSITYAGQYISYIEAALALNYPERKFEFINAGLPSETVSGLSEEGHAEGKFPRPDLHERLARVLQQTRPDLVFASYGMNDGIYLPFGGERFQAYMEGINWLHEEVVKAGAIIIHLTPPVFDERKGPAYANVLDIYSDWLISNRYTKNWEVVDVHEHMKKYMADKRLLDPDFKYAADGVHPDKAGHWIMARPILEYLGLHKLASFDDAELAIASLSNGPEVLNLVEERQLITKDAWLTATGHTRPGMKTGLTMNEAEKKANEIQHRIDQQLR